MEQMYRDVLKRQPDHVDALRGLGNVAKRLQHYRDAATFLRRTVELAPDYAVAWGELGAVLLELDEHDEALESIRRALRLEPDSAAHQLNLGNALARAGGTSPQSKPSSARRVSRAGAPGHSPALGNAFKTVGRHGDAVGAYRRSIALQPEYAEGYGACRI
jgi:tetratricopeptide (TPR) repeat protein